MAKRPTYRRVAALLRYDPRTGRLFWRESRGRVRAGQRAGFKSSNGSRDYWCVHIDGRRYTAGQIAWLLVTRRFPRLLVDYKNENTLDTAWTNLFLATQSERRNRATLTTITTKPFRNRYVAHVTVNGKRKFIASFETAAEAQETKIKAKMAMLTKQQDLR